MTLWEHTAKSLLSTVVVVLAVIIAIIVWNELAGAPRCQQVSDGADYSQCSP